ncbi:MAG: hypothetical protein MJ198_05525 [Bacteroidales bacterium]|nr:hypothetical protein [Bacteroidales bacterium]
MKDFQNIKIRTYNGIPKPNAVYVLSRGSNSGKLQKAPCPNCYEIISETNRVGELSAAVHILFCSGRLRPYLHGSVIEFVRLEHYRKLFLELWNNIDPTVMEKTATVLKGIEICQVETLKKLKQLKEMRFYVAKCAIK